jgi:hypothetical protein
VPCPKTEAGSCKTGKKREDGMRQANEMTRRKIYKKKRKRDLRLRSSQVAVALKIYPFSQAL